MTSPYGEGPCSCPESLWLRALLTGIVTADTEQGLADAVAAAASALQEEAHDADEA